MDLLMGRHNERLGYTWIEFVGLDGWRKKLLRTGELTQSGEYVLTDQWWKRYGSSLRTAQQVIVTSLWLERNQRE